MSEVDDAYKLATEAGREASKQMIVVSGGLLAGYLAFAIRPEADKILGQNYPLLVISLLFASLFASSLSLGCAYNMHAHRSQFLRNKTPINQTWAHTWEWHGIKLALASYGFCLLAILAVIVMALI